MGMDSESDAVREITFFFVFGGWAAQLHHRLVFNCKLPRTLHFFGTHRATPQARHVVGVISATYQSFYFVLASCYHQKRRTRSLLFSF
jgi:hypothetical protein